jgi:hypothetical protein
MGDAAEKLVAQLKNVQGLADKQLSLLLMVKEPLKDTNFHQFMRLMKSQRDQFDWPDHIVPDDPSSTPDLNSTQRGQLDKATVDGLTTLLHIRNANAFIHACVRSHLVEGLLETCERGRARQAMDMIRGFYRPKTQAGRRIANQKFYNDG